MPRRQKQVHGSEQSVRPCIDGPHGSLAPVKAASELGHFALAKNAGWFVVPGFLGGGTRLGHRGQRPAKELGTLNILLLWKAIGEMQGCASGALGQVLSEALQLNKNL